MLAKKKVSENISNVSPNENKNLDGEFFTHEEWTHLKNEINKQMAEGSKIIDFVKAVNNARYLAKLDRSIQQEKDGKFVKFTDEEWEKFINGQELY